MKLKICIILSKGVQYVNLTFNYRGLFHWHPTNKISF